MKTFGQYGMVHVHAHIGLTKQGLVGALHTFGGTCISNISQNFSNLVVKREIT